MKVLDKTDYNTGDENRTPADIKGISSMVKWESKHYHYSRTPFSYSIRKLIQK